MGRAEKQSKSNEEEQVRMLGKQRRQMLLMLELRFGLLPEGTVRRVEEASREVLESWTAGLVGASSIEELLH